MLKKFFEFFIKNSDKTIVSSKGNNNIVITNNSEVWVDGKKVKGIENEKEINVFVTGDVEKLEVAYCEKLEIKGNCENVSSQSGDINCINIKGNASTMSGDIISNSISGEVRTMSGDVVTKK